MCGNSAHGKRGKRIFRRSTVALVDEVGRRGLGGNLGSRELFARSVARSCKVMIGIGDAFDVQIGHMKDAPAWAKAAGLQWVDRLL